MHSASFAGRVFGALLLVQGALAPFINFRLLPPGNRTGFIDTAAAHAPQIRLALLLSFVMTGLTVAGAIVVWPVLRRHAPWMALAYLAVALIGFGALASENLALRQMLAMSEQVARGAGGEVLRAIAAVARETWRQAHFTTLLFGTAGVLLLHIVLFRARLVPRILAGAGMAASLLGMGAVATPLFGGVAPLGLVAPMGFVQLALTGWLLARGFPGEPGTEPRMGTQ